MKHVSLVTIHTKTKKKKTQNRDLKDKKEKKKKRKKKKKKHASKFQLIETTTYFFFLPISLDKITISISTKHATCILDKNNNNCFNKTSNIHLSFN